MSERLVIIGGVAAGMSAAARARRTNADLEITVFERSGYVSYGACGFPYFIKGEIPAVKNLLARSVEQFAAERIDVRLHHEVTAIDRTNRTVEGINRQTGERFSAPWDKLILASGVQAARPALPGSGLAGIFTLRNVEDALAIKTWLTAAQPRRAVILGGSYAGLEMAEALKAQAIDTVIVERQPRVLSNLDTDISAQVQGLLQAQGVELRLERAAVSFIGERLVTDITTRVTEALRRAELPGGYTGVEAPPLRVREVQLGDETLPADLVIVVSGGRPNTTLAVQAGLTLGPTGAVAVDRRQQTSDERIWAAGAVSEVYHRLLQGPVYMPTALNANKQGRVAGTNAAGGKAEFAGTFGASVVKIFETTLAHTGLTEAAARECGLDAHSVSVTGWSRAAYMPGSMPIHLKLVFEKGTQRVLGAQMLGADGVAKRIDVVSAALQANWTLQDLSELDTTYTPPAAPVWEPLVVAANLASRSA